MNTPGSNRSTATNASRAVVKTVRGMAASDGAGVRLSRVIGQPALPDLDPFLMLDEFRSDDAKDYIAGFPDHPHRGFETVTYMLAGRMRHGDNQGNTGLLRAGSAQWMTAGRGIVHSEMPEQENGLMWGFQLWVNLPARLKMTASRYQDIEPEAIPTVALGNGGTARVVAGRVGDKVGPVSGIVTEPIYLDVALAVGGAVSQTVPSSHNAFLYVYDGAARVGPSRLDRGTLGVLGPGEQVEVSAEAEKPARFILVAGKPIGEPVVKYGPFVMNTENEIRQAITDFRAGRF